MSIEILDCLKHKRDILIKTILHFISSHLDHSSQPKYGLHVYPRPNNRRLKLFKRAVSTNDQEIYATYNKVRNEITSQI